MQLCEGTYLRVDEPLEDGELFAFRNSHDVDNLRLAEDVGRRHLEVDVVHPGVVRLHEEYY